MLYSKLKKCYRVLCVYEMTYNTQKKKYIFAIKFIGGPQTILHLGRLQRLSNGSPHKADFTSG